MMLFGKKIIYFVRHGESANNLAGLRQGSSGGLSEKGREQAHFVGERLEKASIDVIISSSYDRAKETSAIINETVKKPVEYTNLLVERKNPSEVIGKNAESEEVKKIMDVIDRSFHDNSFRYSDEENFQDLKVRAEKLLDFLAQKKERRILCVSHRIFLKMVFAVMEKGVQLDSHEFVKLDFYNKVQNTAIAICTYEPLKKLFGKNPWKLLAFNDYGRVVE